MAAKTCKTRKDKCAPDHGTDLYQCRKCFHVTDMNNYDVGGADPGKVFCNQCHHEQHPVHVGWMRTNWLYRDEPADE